MDKETLLEEQTQNLIISDEIKEHLIITVKWSYFLAILGFVGLVFITFAGMFMTIFSFGAIGNGAGVIPMYLFGIIYLVFGIIYFFPIKYLLNFSLKTKKALTTNNQEILNESFKNLKSHYKFIGIILIITFGVYILSMLSFVLRLI
jgi:hypothetical protein